jgi:hypothetical protein
MNADMLDLGLRAVACKGWRWMPGMRWWTDDDRGRLDDFQPEYMGRPPDALPDLTDPATLGCLLALVREAWGDPTLHVVCAGGSVELGVWHARWGTSSRRGATEADALVVALKGAPNVSGEHRREEKP